MNKKNRYMLEAKKLQKKGYDWWWHSFTGYEEETGEAKAFFIEYFVINPGLSQKDPVFGQLPISSKIGAKPSYAMVKAGSWGKEKKQIHNMYPFDKFAYNQDPFKILIGDNELSNEHLKGQVYLSQDQAEKHPEYMSDSGYMKWDLQVTKELSYDVGYGSNWFFRWLNAFEMYWHAEGLKSTYQGRVEYEGKTYLVDHKTSYGYQDKNWGQDYTSPWIWLNCCNLRLKDDDKSLVKTCFDFGGGKPVVFGQSLNGKILGVFYYMGRKYEYNFSKFWHFGKQVFRCREGKDYLYFDIKCANLKSMIKVRFKVAKCDLLFVNYENPDGKKRHNHLYNGGTAFGQVKLYQRKLFNRYELIAEFEGQNGGCEYGVYDT